MFDSFDSVIDFLQNGLFPALASFVASLVVFLISLPIIRFLFIRVVRKHTKARLQAEKALEVARAKIEILQKDKTNLIAIETRLKALDEFFYEANGNIEDLRDELNTLNSSVSNVVVNMQLLEDKTSEIAISSHVIQDNTITGLDAMQLAWGNRIEGANDVLNRVNNKKILEQRYEEIENLKGIIRQYNLEKANNEIQEAAPNES